MEGGIGMVIKPKAGEVWRESIDKDSRDTYCFVIEENGKLYGIWFGLAWKVEPLDNIEDGKDGWKKVFSPQYIEQPRFA